MNSACDLALTGANVKMVSFVACVLLVVSILLAWRLWRHTKIVVVLIVSVLIGQFCLFPSNRVDAATCGSASTEHETTAVVDAPKEWSPAGRFTQAVFDSGDIDTQVVDVGSIINFSGNPETLRITLNRPKSSVDTESSRPLIVALAGGETAGFCDSSFTTEQDAMLELAQLGYVTATVHPLLDPAFCDGEPEQSYIDNMNLYLNATDQALQYLQTNAASYGINYSRTALYGYSIGGQTALLKLRAGHNSGPNVRVITAFAAISPFSQDGTLGAHIPASSTSPDIFMMSFEPDIGFGPGVTPDARQDCTDLTGIGYECQFTGLPFPSHAVHANSNFPGNLDVRTIYWPYLYSKIVED